MMSKSLVIKKANERVFLDQLFNPNKLENYNIPDSIKAELRKYQQVSVQDQIVAARTYLSVKSAFIVSSPFLTKPIKYHSKYNNKLINRILYWKNAKDGLVQTGFWNSDLIPVLHKVSCPLA